MKFIHTGDLHIGKVLNGFSLLEDQRHILGQIIEIACRSNVDAVLLAGDLYDRSVPSSEAVTLLDHFISTLIHKGIKVLAISGNHDSPERLGFASTILSKQGFFMESCFGGELKCVTLEDKFGEIDFYLLPFMRPAFVNEFTEAKSESSQEGIIALIQEAKINISKRNVMIAHHFVTHSGMLPGECTNDDSIYVGDIDNIDASCFGMFDYTALGHIHRAMKIGPDNVYYSGSPLKYGLREANHAKGIYLVDIKEKGEIEIEKIPLIPLRDLRIIKGELGSLLKEDVVNASNPEDYICAVLTNQEELLDPIGKLRNVYPNVLQILFEKSERNNLQSAADFEHIKEKSTQEMYDGFYQYVTGRPLDPKREAIIHEIIKEAKRGEYL